MSDKKDFCEMIPVDDISLFYADASESVRRSISLLLQANERFYVYGTTLDKQNNRVMCVLDEPFYGEVLYNVLFDFVQRYGHFQFFKILLNFLNSNTHPVTASMLHEMLTKHLNESSGQGSSRNIDTGGDA